MNLRIEQTPKAKNLLWKLERKQSFKKQFESANAFIEFSLETALQFYDRYPSKQIGKYDFQ